MKTELQQLIEEKVSSREIELRTPNELGGPVGAFDLVGRATVVFLLEHGLCPTSKVLDLGCGALRVGYWLVRLLEPGCYCGIEPDAVRLEIGLRSILGEDLVRAKNVRTSTNGDFDMSVFGERFDFIFGRSIWSHTSRAQICAALDSAREVLAPDGILFMTIRPATAPEDVYAGDGWALIARYDAGWIEAECKARNLSLDRLLPVSYLDASLLAASGQQWLKICREDSAAARDRKRLVL